MGAKSNSNLGLAPVCYRRVQVQVVVCWGLIFGVGLAALSVHRFSTNPGATCAEACGGSQRFLMCWNNPCEVGV